jgi:hypothetical protein
MALGVGMQVSQNRLAHRVGMGQGQEVIGCCHDDTGRFRHEAM